MSADLHLRVFDPAVLPEALVRRYLELENAPFPEGPEAWREYEVQSEQQGELYRAIYALDFEERKYLLLGDDCWIGQVSWAKADAASWRKWVPRSVEHFSNAYEKRGHLVPLTPGFCAHLLTGFNLPHDSHYETYRDKRGGTPKRSIYGRSRFDTRGIAKARKVKKFFEQNMGLLSFLETQ